MPTSGPASMRAFVPFPNWMPSRESWAALEVDTLTVSRPGLPGVVVTLTWGRGLHDGAGVAVAVRVGVLVGPSVGVRVGVGVAVRVAVAGGIGVTVTGEEPIIPFSTLRTICCALPSTPCAWY